MFRVIVYRWQGEMVRDITTQACNNLEAARIAYRQYMGFPASYPANAITFVRDDITGLLRHTISGVLVDVIRL